MTIWLTKRNGKISLFHSKAIRNFDNHLFRLGDFVNYDILSSKKIAEIDQFILVGKDIYVLVSGHYRVLEEIYVP